ncbi:MAG: PhzF family phenazine biosynthesis isomerase [Bacteroidota bacterium]|nr:PhzF family phenazine biosynthesis isomerase [Bacteroidota bacterium]
MKEKFSLITVFSDFEKNIRGNVSAVVMLSNELTSEQMQTIASDFNQPATTFLWKGENNAYNIRWFAPDAEIMLCGHGSLAATAFLSENNVNTEFTFIHKKGKVIGSIDENGLCSIVLDAIPVTLIPEVPEVLKEGLGIQVIGYFASEDKFIVLAENEKAVKNMKPDFSKLRESKVFGYAVTAKGDDVDFVSRTLVPHVQQLEDHATGSSHAVLTPFWSERLNKKHLKSLQLSSRGGSFICEMNKNSVEISGKYEVLAEGFINL